MPDPSTLINAYIDVNLLLAAAFVLWVLVTRLLSALGLGHCYSAQLRALRIAFLTILLSPLIVWGLVLAGNRAGVALAEDVNLTNFVVAQYLQGHFEMDAGRLESMLAARRQFGSGGAGTAATMVWGLLALGFLVLAARFAASVVKLRRLLDESFVWRRFGRLELRLSDGATVPFSTRGLRRRIVVLPSAMLAEPEDLRIALGHELQHLRQRDVDWEIGLELLKPLFFWNPAYHLWRRRTEELRELSCDRQVLMRKGYDVATYCQCLLRVCHNSLRRRGLLGVSVPVVALVQTENRLFGRRSARVLRHRMLALIEGRSERHPGSLALALGLPLVGLTLLAAVAIQRPGDWSQDRLMLSTIVNLERLAVMNATSTLIQPGY